MLSNLPPFARISYIFMWYLGSVPYWQRNPEYLTSFFIASVSAFVEMKIGFLTWLFGGLNKIIQLKYLCNQNILLFKKKKKVGVGRKRIFCWEVVPDLVSRLCVLGVVTLHGLGSWEHPSGMWPPTCPWLNPCVWQTSVGVFDHQTPPPPQMQS